MRLIRVLPFLLSLAGASPLAAQFEPASTGGDAAIARDLAYLGQNRRVLVIGAHPDDEDSELLTILSRGMGAEAAYLSLTRGEGGQNLIGAELGEALGLVRSEELLAARRVDGARQFFSRAYDFGFSKSLEDTWRHWPRDSVLKDVVRIVRRFRPQVIVSIFRGEARDGHGQHQAAGWSANEAFLAAGDPARFPELAREEGLAPWAPYKLYLSTRFDTTATTLTLDGGVLDPTVGQSFHQIAMRSRSLHRSQDMGQVQRTGPSSTRLRLLASAPGIATGPGDGMFDAIDSRIEAVLPAESDDGGLRRYRRVVMEARRAFGEGVRSGARQHLGVAARLLAEIRARPGSVSRPELDDQARHLHRALAALLEVVPDAFVSQRTLVAGDSAFIVSRVWNAGRDTLEVRAVLLADGGDGVSGPRNPLPPGAVVEDTLRLTLPPDEPVTTPYFLRQPREGDLYHWPADAPSLHGLPFEPPPFAVRHELFWAGATLAIQREAVFRYNDQATGEVRAPVAVTPRVSVRVEPVEGIWNTRVARATPVRVTLTNTGRQAVGGRVRLSLPTGWSPTGAKPFRLSRGDESVTIEFALTAPRNAPAGRYQVAAVAVDDAGREYRLGSEELTYPHIRSRVHTVVATSEVARMSVALPPLRQVGYVRGAADRVPEALRAAGVPLVLLDPATIGSRSLSGFDAIVIGPRAFETEPALALANVPLLEYARAGGTLIVQYQQYGYFLAGLPPLPMALASREPGQAISTASTGSQPRTAGVTTALIGGHDRVTDERAEVRIIDPANPAVTRPNRIGSSDWDGWVQERGLYIPREWDPAFRPVLETGDPDEAPLRGALLIAPLGKGRYVYTGLSFFRQLPAGVPGGFRLFANLLGLGWTSRSRSAAPEVKVEAE